MRIYDIDPDGTGKSYGRFKLPLGKNPQDKVQGENGVMYTYYETVLDSVPDPDFGGPRSPDLMEFIRGMLSFDLRSRLSSSELFQKSHSSLRPVTSQQNAQPSLLPEMETRQNTSTSPHNVEIAIASDVKNSSNERHAYAGESNSDGAGCRCTIG